MVKRVTPSSDEILAILDEVKDPEVPVLSIVELGIVRDVSVSDEQIVVTITPTYSGCPAMREIESAISAAFAERGVGPVELRTVYSPAWTTDCIGAEAREKLRAYGIAPPGRVPAVEEFTPLRRRAAIVACPYCGATETERRSEFGSTACKSIWYCRSCMQPFEEFKAI